MFCELKLSELFFYFACNNGGRIFAIFRLPDAQKYKMKHMWFVYKFIHFFFHFFWQTFKNFYYLTITVYFFYVVKLYDNFNDKIFLGQNAF